MKYEFNFNLKLSDLKSDNPMYKFFPNGDEMIFRSKTFDSLEDGIINTNNFVSSVLVKLNKSDTVDLSIKIEYKPSETDEAWFTNTKMKAWIIDNLSNTPLGVAQLTELNEEQNA